MSDFGAPEVNWHPLPRAARPVVTEASKASAARQTSACARLFSRSEKKTAGGFRGRFKPPQRGRGGAPENFGFSLFEWPNFVSPGDL